jgi:4-hydroxybenzoate polyprenyltransferase
MISKYIRLLRPIAWITFFLPFSIGLGLGITQKTDIVHVVFAFLVFIFWMSFSFILNAIGDINVDKLHNGRSKDMNLAKQPIVTGEITVKKALFLSIIFFSLSVIFAWLISPIFLFITFIINIIGFIYSMRPFRLKTKPFGDIICNATAAVGIFTACLSLNEKNFDFLVIFGSFTIAAVFYIPTVVTDFEFDKMAGLRTSAVFLGVKKTLQIMSFLTILNVVIWFLILISLNNEFKVLALISIVYSIIFTLVSNINLKQDRLHLHENWILIPFPVISFIFILYGVLKLMGFVFI